MTRYFTIILILGLAFSQEQEFIYSTLVDTSLEHDPFFWTSAVYKFDEQGLMIFLFVTIICISTDIGGYIFGKIFKGPIPYCPSIPV